LNCQINVRVCRRTNNCHVPGQRSAIIIIIIIIIGLTTNIIMVGGTLKLSYRITLLSQSHDREYVSEDVHVTGQ